MNIDSIKILNPQEVVVEFMTQRIEFGFGGLIAFTTGDHYEKVRGRIVETRYKLKEGYKITCVPDDESYATKHFYQLDFCSMINAGIARILPTFIDYGIGT